MEMMREQGCQGNDLGMGLKWFRISMIDTFVFAGHAVLD